MKRHKKLAIGALSALLSAQVWIGTLSPTAFAADIVSLKSQEMITSGAVLKKYEWQSTRGSSSVSTDANVIEIDLTNPNVKLDAMTGSGNQVTKKQTVTGMTREYGAVAGINADVWNTKAEGVPIGPDISGGKLVSSPSTTEGLYAFAISKDNMPIIDTFRFNGTVKAADGTTFPIGGFNKSWLDDDPQSHKDGLFMYTSAWPLADRSNDGTNVPTEVLVQNGIIAQISLDSVINMAPPQDGYILRAAGAAADFIKLHVALGQPLVADYGIVPENPATSYDTANFKMMIGGHTLLVFEGQPSFFTKDIVGVAGYSYRARTAVGYSKDNKTAYLITVDNSGNSDGMSLPELQKFMVQIGVWKGMNMDGGGSTQMAARPLGDTTPVLTNSPEYGSQRPVVDSIGVFSTAPQGQLKGLTLKSPAALFIGENASLSFKGYDQYYNPVSVDGLSAQWSTSSSIGAFNGNVFTPTKAGQSTITAVTPQGSGSVNVQVLGRDQLKSLKLTSSNSVLAAGQSYKLTAIATSTSGISRAIPLEALKVELVGIQGDIQNGTLTVKSLSGKSGQIIASYDGYSTMLTMTTGIERKWYDLEANSVMTTSSSYPDGIKASVSVAKESSGNHVLELAYDFSPLGAVTKAAYAEFDAPNGTPIPGTPQYIKLRANGDNGKNVLKMEVMDADGDVNRIELAPTINWTGWKNLTVDLSPYNLTYPIKILHIYVVNPAESQDERAQTGKIQLDDISFVDKAPLAPLPLNTVKIAINKKTGTVNGKTIKLPTPPIVKKTTDGTGDRTLVPIKFITEALGGEVRWDGSNRKVTVIRGDKIAVLWIDNPNVAINGSIVVSPLAPIISDSSTLVPLRLVSESLGWDVSWEPKGQIITLK
jgi:hypothetical protein